MRIFTVLIFAAASLLNSAVAQKAVLPPESIVNVADNCGFNVLDIIYLSFFPKAIVADLPRYELLKRFDEKHAFSIAEIQSVISEMDIGSHAFKADSIEEILPLLNSKNAAILFLERGEWGHFLVCRRVSDSRVELLDFPKKPSLLTTDSEFVKSKRNNFVALICERGEGQGIEPRVKSASVTAIDRSPNKQAVSPDSTVRRSYSYPAKSWAFPLENDPSKLETSIRIHRAEGDGKFSIVDVKGACSCFSGYRVEAEEGSLDLTVHLQFDRFKFNPSTGTQVAIVVAPPNSKEQSILQAEIESHYPGELGKAFILPSVIKVDPSQLSDETLSIYVPKEKFDSFQNPKVIGTLGGAQPQTVQLDGSCDIQIGNYRYKKLMVKLELSTLKSVLSDSTAQISIGQEKFVVPLQKRVLLW